MKIYRYMGMFELYKIINEKEIKLSNLTLMNDLNEGIGLALSSQVPSAFNLGYEQKHEMVLDFHSKIRKCTFISSWTEVKDSMAMWLLYSKNADNIRVTTTRKKLNKALQKYSSANHWTKHLKSTQGTIQTDIPGEVKGVQYSDFNTLIEEMHNLKKVHRSEVDKLYSIEKNEKKRSEKYLKLLDENRSRGELLTKKLVNYKSVSYSFEKEIRASIHLFKRNDLSYTEWLENEDSKEMSYAFGTATIDYNDTDFPDTINIPLEADFIDEVCFDPRMPLYKQEVLKTILKFDESLYITSKVFGSFSNTYDLGMSYYE